MQEELEFCFKGSRNYVHGTDIYNKLVGLFSTNTITNVDLSFHNILRNNVIIYEVKPKNENSINFVFKYHDTHNIKKFLYGVENLEKISCQYDYNEESIYKQTVIDLYNQEIELSDSSSFSFIEECVATNKYLLQNLFPQANGKWYFTRLQLSKPQSEDFHPLKLKLKSNFNFKLTKTAILLDNKEIGYIYFSLKG